MRVPAVDASLLRLHLDGLEDEAELSGVEVTGDLSGAVAAHVELAGCRVVAARFTGGRFESLRVTDCAFEDCDLSGAMLRRAALTRVTMRQCRPSGVVIDRSHLKDVRITDSKLDDANFRMAVGERVEFHDCLLPGADFAAARLRPGLRLFDCDLHGADFSKADLRGARLHGSQLDGLRGAEWLVDEAREPG